MSLKTVFVTEITDTWSVASDGDPVGSIRWEWSDTYGWCCYKCVLYDNGAAVDSVVGMASCYVDDTGPAAHTVSMDKTSGALLGAGIHMSIIADGSWGWIQIKGRAVGVSGLLHANANDTLAITPVDSTVDGELTVVNADSEHVCGVVIDESAFEIICDFPY